MTKSLSRENGGFGFLVRDISRLLRRQMEKQAGDVGLTHAQWQAIGCLAHHEGINQATLADMMGTQPITLVGLLDKLERAGWIERRRDPADRRARRLYLTRAAQPLIQKMESIETQMRKEAFTGFSTRQQQEIMVVLQRVKDNLSPTENPTESNR